MDFNSPHNAGAENSFQSFDNFVDIFPVGHHRNTIKYTKLPDYEFDSRVSWNKNSYVLPPRLRRIIAMDDEINLTTSRSLGYQSQISPDNVHSILKNNPLAIKDETTRRSVSSSRKVVTISEDQDIIKVRNTNKNSQMQKNSKEDKTHNEKRKKISKVSNVNSNHITKLSESRRIVEPQHERSPYKKSPNSMSLQHTNRRRPSEVKQKGTTLNSKTMKSSKTSLSKNTVNNEKTEVINQIKNQLMSEAKSHNVPKTFNKPTPRAKPTKTETFREATKKTKPISTIHVPIENKRYERPSRNMKEQGLNSHNIKEAGQTEKKSVEIIDIIADSQLRRMNYSSDNSSSSSESNTSIVDQDIEPFKNMCHSKDIYTETHLNVLEKSTDIGKTDFAGVDRGEHVTTIDSADFENILKDVNLDDLNDNHDNLYVPDVSLLSNKLKISDHSLPNLHKVPGNTVCNKNKICKVSSDVSTPYVIKCATLTYTTKKKIDFHVISKQENMPITATLAYPFNVMSVLRNEIKKSEAPKLANSDFTKSIQCDFAKKDIQCEKAKEGLMDLSTFSLSNLDKSPLVKPSEIIQSMRVNNNFIESEFNCEQFQKELNFIDSFFESLQFLENSSLSKTSINKNKLDSWASDSNNLKSPEYQMLMSKLKTVESNEDAATIASNSLCLLNLLIRDEQRRAKNLLLVLKMREDALRDFTKSHILWLENKKKQDNTDITVSTLKKKQRGALMKLQHECGEMQRMRKALLALSEKRKLALMKAKKIIELKSKNNINTDQITIAKKKIKRSTNMDRNIAPLKCFDLSSSGCDEGNISGAKSESAVFEQGTNAALAEKSIQTNDSIVDRTKMSQGNEASARDFVKVDGSYLNILFQNLSLPPMFSHNKSYEVNEEALTNIVSATTTLHNVQDSGIVEKIMDQIKTCDQDKSSSPSTARSLVEEVDQYYKDILQDTRSDSPDRDKICVSHNESEGVISIPVTSGSCLIESKGDSNGTSQMAECVSVPTEEQSVSPRGCALGAEPLPLHPCPEGAPTQDPTHTSGLASKFTTSPISRDSNGGGSSGEFRSTVTSGLYEAEELRRQQIAIEREIKVLEQQQKQLLVLREIPDKPPPPYTPPVETRPPRPANTLVVDDITEHQIHAIITGNGRCLSQSNDAFELFVNDYCQETINNNQCLQSDMPWDSCNLLPQKPQLSGEQLAKKTSQELKEILSGSKPTIVSGVSARRSDHIDDILFTEWRRCEPEWTKLHADETNVKNQVYEKIFNKLLDETIVAYEEIVPSTTDTE